MRFVLGWGFHPCRYFLPDTGVSHTRSQAQDKGRLAKGQWDKAPVPFREIRCWKTETQAAAGWEGFRMEEVTQGEPGAGVNQSEARDS